MTQIQTDVSLCWVDLVLYPPSPTPTPRTAIEPEFEVIVGQPEYVVRPGGEARLPCQAGGDVRVQSIVWDREGEELPTGITAKCA